MKSIKIIKKQRIRKRYTSGFFIHFGFLLDAIASSKFALGRAQASLALLSLTHLLPRILVSDGAVLELLAAEEDVLIVLFAVCPVLLVVYAVATCTLQGLHG